MATRSNPGGPSPAAAITVRYLVKMDTLFITEELSCIREGANLKIIEIPLHAPRLAVNDLISAKYDPTDQAFYFDRKILPSGNSTVRLIVHDAAALATLKDQFIARSCPCTVSYSKKLLAVNIPKSMNYAVIRQWLIQGEARNHWQFEEGCLAHCIMPEHTYRTSLELEQEAAQWRQRLGETLYECRRNLGLSSNAVAFDLDMTADTIDAMETADQSIPLLNYLMACVYFGLAPYDAFRAGSPEKLLI